MVTVLARLAGFGRKLIRVRMRDGRETGEAAIFLEILCGGTAAEGW
jgi:hypothetical protein